MPVAKTSSAGLAATRVALSALRGGIPLVAVLLMSSCTTVKTTTTARTATEQLLLSTATDHALQNTGLQIFAGRKVFLDVSDFDSYDSKYVEGTMRDGLSRLGGLLAGTVTNSGIVLEARSGGLAIDESDTMFGIPSMPIPIPLAGVLQTPELAFYKSQKQRAYAKFALFAHSRETAAHIYSSGPLDGKAYDLHFRLLFISWRRTDVPEKKLTREEAQKFQTWSPQYDLGNLPATNGVVK